MAFMIPRNPTLLESLGQGLQLGLPGLVAGAQQRTGQQATQQLAQRLGINIPMGLPPQLAQQLIAQSFDPFGQQAANVAGTIAQTGLTGAREEFVSGPQTAQTQAAAQRAGVVPLGPGSQLFGLGGEPIGEQVPPAPPTASKTNLIGTIGAKIAAGIATPGEEKVFNRLTESAGTEVTINNIEQLTPNVGKQISALKEAQSLINSFIADPNNAEVLKKSDVNVVTNTKGQLQLEVKPKGAPAATQIKELSDLVGLQNSMKTIDALFDPSFVGLVEGSSFARGISEGTGINIIESVKQRRKVALSPKQVQFSRIVNDLSDRLLRARSGAQINEQEFQRLKKIVPVLEISEVAFKNRAKGFLRELNSIIATKQRAIQQAGQRPLQLAPTGQQQTGLSPKKEARFQELLRKSGQ